MQGHCPLAKLLKCSSSQFTHVSRRKALKGEQVFLQHVHDAVQWKRSLGKGKRRIYADYTSLQSVKIYSSDHLKADIGPELRNTDEYVTDTHHLHKQTL